MIIDVKLNDVKAGEVARAIAEKLDVTVKYLPRPYLGYAIGKEADQLAPKAEADVVAGFYFLSCQGKLVLPNDKVDLHVVNAVMVTLKEHDWGWEIVEDHPVEESPAVREDLVPVEMDGKFTVNLPSLDGDLREKFLNLLDSKRSLICSALGTDDIPVYDEQGVMHLPWFESIEGKEDGAALADVYLLFVDRLIEYAVNHKHISPIEKNATNEKYTFRCFLLRLGFIGKQFSFARKVLLSKLEGNGAWLNGTPAKEVE